MESDKAQLHDYDLESGVLGAILLEREIFSSLPDWDDEVFYKPANKTIAHAITILSKQEKPIDMLSVVAQLKETNRLNDVGGAYSISQLTQRVASTSSTEYHYRKLYEYYLLRKLSEMGFEIKNSVLENSPDPFEIIERYVQKMEALTSKLSKFNINTLAKLSDVNIQRMKEIRSGIITAGIPSGFKILDKSTGGWQKGELTVLAARPGMGKTALALQFAIQPAIQHNIPTAFFSLEMGNTPITSRVQSIITSHNAKNIIQGNVTTDDIRSIEMSMNIPAGNIVFIDDTPSLSISQLRIRARRLKKEQEIELIIVDYLQLMTCDIRGNREQEISYISRSLKALAKELDIPIIALSQLSRDVEKTGRKSKRPQLSDLRESGAIEQDADNVYFIYRPEYYGMETFDDDIPAAGMAEIIIAKARNGSIAYTILGFEGRNVRFYDLSEPTNTMQANLNFETEKDIIT